MKTYHLLPLVAGLVLATGFVPQAVGASKVPADNVTVAFQDPDNFTDVRESQTNRTSTYYLDVLKTCLQETASPVLAPGQKLAVTVLDIDLAGDIRPGSTSSIRIMKDIYPPRMYLKFQLLGADGKVVKEGERRLTDLDYLLQIRLPGNQDPLYYDKAILKQWVHDEFKS